MASKAPDKFKSGDHKRPGQAPGGTSPMTRERVLARFIRLCSATFSTPVPQESAALVVNRISELVKVDRAVLVQLRGKHAIQALTGGGAAAQDSAFADAVEAARRRYRDRQDPVVVPPVEVGEGFGDNPDRVASPHVKKVQESMGGTRILWLPLWLSREQDVAPVHALWLERWHNQPWEPGDVELLQHAALFLGHALIRPRRIRRARKRWLRAGIVLALLAFLCLPVTSRVTAPAKVAPDRPHHIFAPMDGILKELFVRPGQRVSQNDLLFRYDARVLEKRLEEARRNVSVARAKLLKLQGAAHRDPDARAEVPVQKLAVERAEADAVFFAKQRDRADVRTAKAGVIVLDDPDGLIGAALQTGQAVMSVADPEQTKLKMMVPSSDVGFLKKGARVEVHLDNAPFQGVAAVITRIGFEVQLSQDGLPSVLAEAVWVDDSLEVRPGQKGSAKIFGDSTLMGIQILRKPVIFFRSLFGF